MVRYIAAFLAALLLALSPSAYAGVAVTKDGVPFVEATSIDFTGIGSTLTTDGSKAAFNLILAGAANGGATSMTTTDTAVSVSYSYVKKALGIQVGLAGTLADGKPGQLLTIAITERAGSGTFILTPTTKTGFASLTFDAVGDSVTLLFVNSTVGWVVISNTSTTVTLPSTGA